MKVSRARLVFLLVGFLFCAFSSYVEATTRRSAEAVRVMNLASVFEGYVKNHNGQSPTSWNDLNTWAELNAWPSLKKFGNPPIQDRYALASNAPVSQELDGSQILAIGRIPFIDDAEAGVGRFVIFRTKDGQYQSEWVFEDKIQKIVAETHLTVPPQAVPQPAIIPTKWPDALYHLTPQQRADLKHSGLLPPEVEASYTSPSKTKTSPPTPSQVEVAPSPNQPASATPAPVTPPPTSKSIAEVAPPSDTGIPTWLYGIIVISIAAIIGAGYYLSKRSGKGP